VHRGWTGFRVMDGPLPAPGSKVQAAGKEIGEVTSAAMLPGPAADIAVALGYIRNEAGTPGTSVEIGPTRARVEALPFAF
jgi:aminomethyltransferase